MLKILSLVTAPIRYPLKFLALSAIALAGALAFGDEVKPLRAACGNVVEWVESIGSSSAFDPAIANSPVKELEFLEGLDEEVESNVIRARTLMRQRRAEIEFTRELLRFREQSLTVEEKGVLPGLVEQVVKTGPEGYTSLQKGQSPAVHACILASVKIHRLQSELDQLLQLDGRVSLLYDRMAQRRKETQGLVPDARAARVAVPEHNELRTPELGEAETLLASAHERLFKALYTISPSLVRE